MEIVRDSGEVIELDGFDRVVISRCLAQAAREFQEEARRCADHPDTYTYKAERLERLAEAFRA